MAKDLENALNPIVNLDAIPETQVDIRIAVIHEDGSLFSSLMNATSLALLQAGIPMHETPITITTIPYKLSNGDWAFLNDPDGLEATKNSSVLEATVLYHLSAAASEAEFSHLRIGAVAGLDNAHTLQVFGQAALEAAQPIYKVFQEVLQANIALFTRD